MPKGGGGKGGGHKFRKQAEGKKGWSEEILEDKGRGKGGRGAGIRDRRDSPIF